MVKEIQVRKIQSQRYRTETSSETLTSTMLQMLKPSSNRESINITPRSRVGIITIHLGIGNLIQCMKTMMQSKMPKPTRGTIIEVVPLEFVDVEAITEVASAEDKADGTTIKGNIMEFVDVEAIFEVLAPAEDKADGTTIKVNIMEVVDVEAIFEVLAPAEDAADETITEVDNMVQVDEEVIIEVETMEWVVMEEVSNNTADLISDPMANQEVNIRTAMTWVRLFTTESRETRTT